jgi:predicted GIY-YIG superfamily endonuclease
MSTYVYRAFDAADALLYVGCAQKPWMRIAEHSTGPTTSRWYPLITTVRVEGPYERSEALQIERAAIHAERPKFNHERGPA